MEKTPFTMSGKRIVFYIKVVNSFINPACKNPLHLLRFNEKHGHAIEEHVHVY